MLEVDERSEAPAPSAASSEASTLAVVPRKDRSLLPVIGVMATFGAVVVLLQPAATEAVPGLRWRWGLAIYATVYLVVVLYTFVCLMRRRIDSVVVLYALYVAVVFASAKSHGLKPTEGTVMLASFGILCLLGIYGRSHLNLILKVIRLVASLYLVANLVTIIRYPDGLFLVHNIDTINGIANWLLGYKNPLARIAIPAIGFSALVDLRTKRRLGAWTWVIYAVSLASVILVHTTNGTVCLLILGAGFLLLHVRRMRWIYRLRTFFWIYGAFFLGVVVLRVQYLAKGLLVDVLHKDLTLVGRTYIWDEAFHVLSGNLWLGHGTGFLSITNPLAFGSSVSHPHNYALFAMLSGGFVALVLVIVMWWQSARGLRSAEEAGAGGSCQVLGLTLGMLLIIGCTESLTETPLLYPLMFTACLLGQQCAVEPVERV